MPVIIRKEETDFVNKNPPITFPYQLDIFQKNAINAIEENEHVFVAAPTSAGKSTVAEYAIAKAISENNLVVPYECMASNALPKASSLIWFAVIPSPSKNPTALSSKNTECI